MWAILGAGLAAGSVHVLSGPDHLTAVAPLAVRHPRAASRLGLLWGLGHVLGLGIIATLALAFRAALPLESLSAWSERIVGVVLVVLGIWALRAALRSTIHVHEHEHDGVRHAHLHAHGTRAHAHTHSALSIGILHGVAGSSHLLALVPALALPSTAASVTYLAGYGVGTLASMGIFATLLGSLSQRSAHAGPRVYRWALGTCGIAAVVTGVFWFWSG